MSGLRGWCFGGGGGGARVRSRSCPRVIRVGTWVVAMGSVEGERSKEQALCEIYVPNIGCRADRVVLRRMLRTTYCTRVYNRAVCILFVHQLLHAFAGAALQRNNSILL
jgi:hypothetical protein